MTASLREFVTNRTARRSPIVAEPIGDPEVAGRAAALAADIWALQAPTLIRAAMNGVYACGDAVLRVSRASGDPAAAVRVAEAAIAAGVRTPRPLRPTAVDAGDGVSVTAWERGDPLDRPIDWEEVGAMVAALHRAAPDVDLDAVPWCGDFPWWRFEEFARPVLEVLDAPARRGMEAALERNGGWEARALEGPLVVCHGDVHPGNVITGAHGPVLIDWDLLCIGPPAWDHAMLMTLTERWGGEPGTYDAFAAGYGTSLRGDAVADALAELRLVAATLLRVRAGLTDPAAAAEAEQRLRWWRGDPEAPPWTAQ